MEKERKTLKELSILVLIFAGISLVRMIVDVVLNGFSTTQPIEGLSPELTNVLVIVIWVVGVLFLLPEVYVGYKGIKISQNPDDSKRHITIAKIIFVCMILSLVSLIIELVKGTNLVINILTVADVFIDAALYYFYIRYANAIKKQYQK